MHESLVPTKDEPKWFSHKLLVECLSSLILSTGGLVISGIFLDRTQEWEVFQSRPELFVVVMVLLNLKGNVEMSLTSRLSTAAHKMGGLDWREAIGNVLLVQCQCGIFGFVIGALAWAIGGFAHGIHNLVVLLNVSVMTASLAGFIISWAMCAVVAGSKRLGVDPDNVAAPVAASLGDIVAAVALVFVAIWLQSWGLACLVLMLFLLAVQVPLTLFVLKGHDDGLHSLVFTGSLPVIASISISSVAGLLFSRLRDPKMTFLMPVLNGTLGNIACIQASRLSTSLHMSEKSLPRDRLTLLAVGLPVHLIGFWAGGLIGWYYLVSAVTLSAVSLLATPPVVKAFWDCSLDPDTFAIPIVTAVCDLLGTLALVSMPALFNKAQ